MGLARAWSVALYGVDGVVVEIEADVGAGTVKTQLLGLPDAALHESKDRVKAAIRNSAHDWPTQRVTLGLSPAALPKGGAGYDLALASVVLAAARAVPPERLEHTVLLGELALDGRLRGVRGTLPALLAAYRVGLREAVVPVESLAEASLVEGLRIHGANTLTEVVAWLRGDDKALQPAPKPESPARPVTSDLADVVGQPEARWALEVAAAGAHHLLFSGPPGTGKTMLAQRLSGLAELAERAVAVVGSRAASGYGQHVATEFGYGLAEAGIVVVSGAAYGIDGCAHRGALAAGGATIAVLACGVDVPYPAGHAGLIARIPEDGLVVSEYPPTHTPARHRFLTRNRLIAALGDGTVVVEAGRRSGAKNTAASTSALGRVLMAVPGPITSASSTGCHELLRSGEAVAVSSVEEVIESTGRIGADLVESRRQSATTIGPPQGDAMRVHEALGLETGHSADKIAVESGVALSTVRALLPEFELAGLAERVDSGWKRSHTTAGRGDA